MSTIPQQNNNNEIITALISRTRIYIIIIVAMLVIGGGGYLISNAMLDSSSLKVQKEIEMSNEAYQDLFQEYSLNEGIVADETEISDEGVHSVKITADKEKATNLIAQYDSITENNRKSIGVEEAYYRKGKLYVLLKNYASAKKEFELGNQISGAKSFLKSKFLANLAGLEEQNNNISEAKLYYQSIVDKYNRTIEYPHAQFSLGRIAEMQDAEKSTSTAQGVYLSLIEDEYWQDSEWVTLAKSRLADLGYTSYNGNSNTSGDANTTQ